MHSRFPVTKIGVEMIGFPSDEEKGAGGGKIH